MLDKGFGIIPNTILFDKELSSTAKLLFCYISSLCSERGYAWASNGHLGEKMGIGESQVSRLLGSLEGYLEFKDGANERRKISLRKNAEVPTQKVQGSLRKNAGHNNTSNNNKPPTPTQNSKQNASLDAHVEAIYEKYLKYFIVDTDGDVTRAMISEAMKRYRFTPKRKAAIERRVKESSFEMVLAAVIGYGRADWSSGKNDRGWKADLADFICRNYENVERGARLYEQQRANKPGGEDAWAALGT